VNSFVTDFGTALGLSLLFISPNLENLVAAVAALEETSCCFSQSPSGMTTSAADNKPYAGRKRLCRRLKYS
jgi:hypothetical protein